MTDRADERQFYEVDAQIAAFNKQINKSCALLSVSKGLAHFEPDRDHSFREVFARADKSMYEQKKKYYQTVGNRRADG